MAKIEDTLTPEERALLMKLAAKAGQEPAERGGEIVDARPGPMQITEEVDEQTNEIVLKVGGVEKHRTKLPRPDYSLKELHPDRFIEEADAAIESGAVAKQRYKATEQKIEALTLASDPDTLLAKALENTEGAEPADVLDTIVDDFLCGHPECGATFKTKRQLTAHKRAKAHDEYAPGGPKYDASFEGARLKKEAEKGDESSDSGTDTEDKE